MKTCQLSVLLLAILLSFSACKKDDEINDEDQIDIENFYGTVKLLKVGGSFPKWSPDGERIAYLINWDLYLINSDGSNDRLLTSEIYEFMKWSPTGTELAYQAIRGGPVALYKIDVDGNKEIKLSDDVSTALGNSWSWSPDGEKIVYESLGYMKTDMYIMNKDGTGNHKVDIPISVFRPSFTPNGNRIMFNSSNDLSFYYIEIFLVETDGSNLQRLKIPAVSVRHAEMKYDESKIYFSGLSYTTPAWDIFEVDPDGSNLKNLTNGVGTNHRPHISPDGKYIAFDSDRDGVNYGLWLMHTDGSNQSEISKGGYGSWSPDSRKVVFGGEVDGVAGIYVLTLK